MLAAIGWRYGVDIESPRALVTLALAEHLLDVLPDPRASAVAADVRAFRRAHDLDRRPCHWAVEWSGDRSVCHFCGGRACPRQPESLPSGIGYKARERL